MQKSFRKFKKIPLVLSSSLLILSFFVYLFIFNHLQENNRLFVENEVQWKQENAKKTEIQAIDRALRMVEKERVVLGAHFVKSSDVVPFLDTLEKLAPRVKAKAEINSVDISSDKKSLLVGLRAVGSFESLYRFITLLENSPYQLEFISMDIVKDQNTQWSATFKIRLLSFME